MADEIRVIREGEPTIQRGADRSPGVAGTGHPSDEADNWEEISTDLDDWRGVQLRVGNTPETLRDMRLPNNDPLIARQMAMYYLAEGDYVQVSGQGETTLRSPVQYAANFKDTVDDIASAVAPPGQSRPVPDADDFELPDADKPELWVGWVETTSGSLQPVQGKDAIVDALVHGQDVILRQIDQHADGKGLGGWVGGALSDVFNPGSDIDADETLLSAAGYAAAHEAGELPNYPSPKSKEPQYNPGEISAATVIQSYEPLPFRESDWERAIVTGPNGRSFELTIDPHAQQSPHTTYSLKEAGYLWLSQEGYSIEFLEGEYAGQSRDAYDYKEAYKRGDLSTEMGDPYLPFSTFVTKQMSTPEGMPLDLEPFEPSPLARQGMAASQAELHAQSIYVPTLESAYAHANIITETGEVIPLSTKTPGGNIMPSKMVAGFHALAEHPEWKLEVEDPRNGQQFQITGTDYDLANRSGQLDNIWDDAGPDTSMLHPESVISKHREEWEAIREDRGLRSAKMEEVMTQVAEGRDTMGHAENEEAERNKQRSEAMAGRGPGNGAGIVELIVAFIGMIMEAITGKSFSDEEKAELKKEDGSLNVDAVNEQLGQFGLQWEDVKEIVTTKSPPEAAKEIVDMVIAKQQELKEQAQAKITEIGENPTDEAAKEALKQAQETLAQAEGLLSKVEGYRSMAEDKAAEMIEALQQQIDGNVAAASAAATTPPAQTPPETDGPAAGASPAAAPAAEVTTPDIGSPFSDPKQVEKLAQGYIDDVVIKQGGVEQTAAQAAGLPDHTNNSAYSEADRAKMNDVIADAVQQQLAGAGVTVTMADDAEKISAPAPMPPATGAPAPSPRTP